MSIDYLDSFNQSIHLNPKQYDIMPKTINQQYLI